MHGLGRDDLGGRAAIGLVAYRTRNLSIACALGAAVVLILDYLTV